MVGQLCLVHIHTLVYIILLNLLSSSSKTLDDLLLLHHHGVMIAFTIDTCGKCEHLYFPGEDVYTSDAWGVVCENCADEMAPCLQVA